MLTDTTTIRHLARRMRERAAEIRAEAAGLQRRTDAVPWQGLAAEAMRAQVGARLATLGTTAGLHDDAAEALERHAAAVDHVVAAALAAEQAVEHAVEDAVEDTVDAVRGGIRGGIQGAAHAVRGLL